MFNEQTYYWDHQSIDMIFTMFYVSQLPVTAFKSFVKWKKFNRIVVFFILYQFTCNQTHLCLLYLSISSFMLLLQWLKVLVFNWCDFFIVLIWRFYFIFFQFKNTNLTIECIKKIAETIQFRHSKTLYRFVYFWYALILHLFV